MKVIKVVHWCLRTRAHEKEVVVLQLALRQVGLASASMNLWQRSQNILKHVKQQTEQRPLDVVELDAVFDTTLEGLRTVGADAREIRAKQATANHEKNLILVVDVAVRKLFCEELVENDAERVHIGLE